LKVCRRRHSELQRLTAHAAVLQTARLAYSKALKELIGDTAH
jgi:hypothetical protein